MRWGRDQDGLRITVRLMPFLPEVAPHPELDHLSTTRRGELSANVSAVRAALVVKPGTAPWSPIPKAI
jgi:hypothetical protein